jgi:hypothetical protein
VPRRDDYDDDYDDEDDLDRRARSRRRDPDDDEEDRPAARRRDYEDDERDDYEERPRKRSRKTAARERVLLPAIFLMVAGGLGLALGLLNAALELTGAAAGPNPFMNPQQANDPQLQQIEKVTKVVGPILNILWGLIVLFGGWQMRSLSSRGFVVFSCVWAMLPCNGCCLLGIPIGIWALVVLNDPMVKRVY